VPEDPRCSVRLLRRETGATLATLTLIALGIAATTTMFSVAPRPGTTSHRSVD
jgi:hypothetical protein